MKTCTQCGTPLGPRNKSGYCRTHFNKQPVSEATKAKRSASMKARLLADPECRERRRQATAAAARTPKARALRSRRAKEMRLWERALGSMSREQLDARNKAVSNAKLAHIPIEYREEYRGLIKRKGFSAAEARQMIDDMISAHAERYRRTGQLQQVAG